MRTGVFFVYFYQKMQSPPYIRNKRGHLKLFILQNFWLRFSGLNNRKIYIKFSECTFHNWSKVKTKVDLSVCLSLSFLSHFLTFSLFLPGPLSFSLFYLLFMSLSLFLSYSFSIDNFSLNLSDFQMILRNEHIVSSTVTGEYEQSQGVILLQMQDSALKTPKIF